MSKSDDVFGEVNLAYNSREELDTNKPNNIANNDFEKGKAKNYTERDEMLPDNIVARLLVKIQNTNSEFFKEKWFYVWSIIKVVILILYLCYFGYAMYYRFGDEGSIRLLVITALVLTAMIYIVVKKVLGKTVKKLMTDSFNCSGDERRKKKIQQGLWIMFWVLAAIGILIFLIFEVAMKEPRNLMSLLGLVLYVLICFVFSYSPAHVRWRPVLAGLFLQFVFALLILRTYAGYQAFKWLGDRVAEFLGHTAAGSSFLFGGLTNQCFAFSVLPVIVFFSSAISVTYYLGLMQHVILKVAYVMQFFMGTTAAESVNAAANIFIGQSEAPLVIRPLIKNMTRSELHAVMTGGFATIAGSVLAAYISFGVPANHLIGASVMSAPAALAMSKLFYPETQISKTTVKNIRKLLEIPPEKNILEAVSNGASLSIKLIANIAVNLVAFLALLRFIDETLSWCGDRVGVEGLTFGLICSYVFYPLSWMMGVETVDLFKVAELVGIKTFLNEFIAYEKLGKIVNNKAAFAAHIAANGTYTMNTAGDFILSGSGTVLVGGVLQERSEVIATYALCGFANFGSIGVMLGALGAMAPHKKRDLSKTVLRAMIAGNVACFMTACIAGLMFEPTIQ